MNPNVQKVLMKSKYSGIVPRLLVVMALVAASLTFSEPGFAATKDSKSTKSTKAAAVKSTTVKSTASSKAKKTTTASKSTKAKKSTKIAKAKKPKVDNYAALVVDAGTGQVLYEKNAGNIRYPASLTKMMTLYLTFDALKRRVLEMDQELLVSAKAASQPQTNISLDKGDRLDVRTAIESLVVRSANDSAMVLGEGLGGTEFNFALMMTQKARELGMKNTVFRNPSGLPDDKQYTTAYDMARLAIALRRDFPEYYHFFKMTSFTHNGVTYPSHNRVMERYAGADGVKTGYIRASGFNLVTSAERNGHRLVAVVMGGTSATSRDREMISLLDRTFAKLEDSDKSVAGTSQVPVLGPSITTLDGKENKVLGHNG
jgi:D-alanyl-D-alanine carboxypeptidase